MKFKIILSCYLLSIFLAHISTYAQKNNAAAATGNEDRRTDTICRCADGSTYSYGNDCRPGGLGCIRNPCPAPPTDCGSND